MMTISNDFTYKTFNPNINDFDKELKTVWEDVDKTTARKLKRFHFMRSLCCILLLPCVLVTLMCGVCADEISMWFLFGFFGGLFSMCFCIYYTADMDNKEDAIYEEFRNTHFDEEITKCLRYNEEQEQIARVWREEHPFEEKIRMAKTRGSSVDIAEMIKHYEEYIKKIN
jgi:hypothetical protein